MTSRLTEARALSRLGKLRLGTRAMKRITWPGLGTDCILRVLSREEVQECKADAHERFRKLNMPVDVTTYSDFEEEVANQMLHRACRDVDHPDEQTFAVDADDLRAHTTVDEFAAVLALYRDFQAEHDPGPTEMTPELIREMADLVKKKDRSRLSAFGAPVLVNFLLSGDDPLSSSPSGSSGNMH